jgi:prepilin-type N-terminal cleavage/methylation domain-containing protein
MSNSNNNKGFTLIELLVVIAIIGLLASIVLVSLNSARMKARDVRKQADFRSITNALYLFFDEKNRMPNNYNPGRGACEPQTYYDQSMQELVDAGFLDTIPKSPGGGGYCYYNYGGGNSIGALMVTTLEAVPDTTTGIPPSCRPWPSGVNWCDQNSDKAYCICNPY